MMETNMNHVAENPAHGEEGHVHDDYENDLTMMNLEWKSQLFY